MEIWEALWQKPQYLRAWVRYHLWVGVWCGVALGGMLGAAGVWLISVLR